jgi:hypothetical protein
LHNGLYSPFSKQPLPRRCAHEGCCQKQNLRFPIAFEARQKRFSFDNDHFYVDLSFLQPPAALLCADRPTPLQKMGFIKETGYNLNN